MITGAFIGFDIWVLLSLFAFWCIHVYVEDVSKKYPLEFRNHIRATADWGKFAMAFIVIVGICAGIGYFIA